MNLGSKFVVFIKSVWAMKCLVAIQESLLKTSRSKNSYSTSYRSRRDTSFTMVKSRKL